MLIGREETHSLMSTDNVWTSGWEKGRHEKNMRTGSCTTRVTSMVSKHKINTIIRDSSYDEF